MEEQVNQKTISMAIQSSKSAGRALVTVLQMYERHIKEVERESIQKQNQKQAQKQTKKAQKAQNKVGPQKMKIKELVGTGSGIGKVQLKDDDIKKFERVARKYGVKYSINKDKTSKPPTYYFFFQSKDTEVINKAFQDFLGKQLKREKKPTIAQTLQKFKALVAKSKTIDDKTRNKEHVR